MSFKNKVKNRFHVIFSLSKETILAFVEEKAFMHGAALAYFALFSMFPLIFLSVSFLGRYLGEEFILKIIKEFLQNTVGLSNVDEILKVLDTYQLDKGSIYMEIIGIVVVLFASSGFLHSLRNSINEFYNVRKEPVKGRKAIKRNVIEKILALVFLGGFALIFIIIYLFQSIGLSAVQYLFQSKSTTQIIIFRGLDYSFSILLNYLLFLLIFKFLNNAKVTWKVASVGALVTSILLFVGQLIIKYYLHNVFVLGTAGIIGSLFIFLAWVHYSSQIIFVGAKFTFTFSKKIGQQITAR